MGAPQGYQASWWVYLLHQVPRTNFQFEVVESSFAPQDREYQQVRGDTGGSKNGGGGGRDGQKRVERGERWRERKREGDREMDGAVCVLEGRGWIEGDRRDGGEMDGAVCVLEGRGWIEGDRRDGGMEER
uniref:Uncharacterized protein n=1 Tax=Terrapene triunguis TaxID=2587831 RepID=A0A674JKQ8_9SAUR